MAEQNQLALIQEGELQWTPKANAAITALNALVGGGTVKHLADPVLLQGGATAVSCDLYYVDLGGGYRWCYLSILQLKADNFKIGDKLWDFPASFKPIGGATFPLNETATAIVWRPGDAHLFAAGNKWGDSTSLSESYVGVGYFAKQATETK